MKPDDTASYMKRDLETRGFLTAWAKQMMQEAIDEAKYGPKKEAKKEAA